MIGLSEIYTRAQRSKADMETYPYHYVSCSAYWFVLHEGFRESFHYLYSLTNI